jgi:hypothetical protein
MMLLSSNDIFIYLLLYVYIIEFVNIDNKYNVYKNLKIDKGMKLNANFIMLKMINDEYEYEILVAFLISKMLLLNTLIYRFECIFYQNFIIIFVFIFTLYLFNINYFYYLIYLYLFTY